MGRPFHSTTQYESTQQALDARALFAQFLVGGIHAGTRELADFEALRRGEDFTIVEFNGAGAEATHIWDSRMTLTGAWRTLMHQYAMLFEIGAANRARGHRPESLWRVFRRWRGEKRASLRYPPTA